MTHSLQVLNFAIPLLLYPSSSFLYSNLTTKKMLKLSASSDSHNPIKCRQLLIIRTAIILLIFSFYIPLTAQTCRVSAGVNSHGARCYMEVYEYDYVSEKPSFPGGDSKLVEFINKHREYPDKAYRDGIQGKVTCSFVIHPSGSVSHIKVLKGVEETLNQEAVRILGMMPPWVPGIMNGQPVPVRVIWSVPFRK
ncbi:MAG: energy transducer TonB [Bacteroides sp.]|nr:energy transducer TonB [Bacteroides sp.]